jgi:hypothetical protein
LRIDFGDFINKARVVKSPLEEELDNSMKTEDVRTFKH